MAKKKKKTPPEAKVRKSTLDLIETYAFQIILITLFFGLIFRIMALLSLKNSIYFDFLLYDEKIYHTWASKIAGGTYQSSSVYEFAPLFAYIMAFIYKIFSPDVLYIRILNIIFGVSGCYLIYLLGKEMSGRVVGVFACIVACCYKPFIFYSIVPLKASLSVFLFVLTIYLFVSAMNRGSMVKIFFMGVAIGLMLNVRPQCLLTMPLFPLFIAWNNYKRKYSLIKITANFILYLTGIALAVSPFMARNYQVAGKLALTTSQSGFNLYQSNKPEKGPVQFATTSPTVQGIQFTIEASKRVGKKLSSQEASKYWTAEAKKVIKQRPGDFFRRVCKKTLFFFQQSQLTDHYNIRFMQQFVPFLKIPFFSFWFILPLGMAGMLMNALKTEKSLALSLIFMFYASTHMIFFTVTRYRLPLLVILIVFAVMGLRELFLYVRQHQVGRIRTYTGIVVSFLIIGIIPSERTGDMTAYYNGHAIILFSKKDVGKAVQYWEKSSKMNKQYSDFANLALASIYYFRKQDLKKSLSYIDKIKDTSHAAASKYELLGKIFTHQKQTNKAISAYKRSLSINSGQINTRRDLIKILKETDRRRAEKEYRRLMYVSSFYDN